MCTTLIVISHTIHDFALNTITLSETKCLESLVVGRGRGSWVWVNIVGKKKHIKKL